MKPVCQKDSLWNAQLYDVIVWLNTASTEEDQRLILHRCLFIPAHRFAHVMFERGEHAGLHRNQTIKVALKTILCIAFILITVLGKSGLTLFFMKFQTASVRTWSFVNFIYKQGTIRHRLFRKIETKRQCCTDYIGSDSNVAPHTSMSNCFYHMVTIALSVKQINWYEYLCDFNLNHSCIHLWKM